MVAQVHRVTKDIKVQLVQRGVMAAQAHRVTKDIKVQLEHLVQQVVMVAMVAQEHRVTKVTKVQLGHPDQKLFSLLMKILLLHITFQITRLIVRLKAAHSGIRLTSTTS